MEVNFQEVLNNFFNPDDNNGLKFDPLAFNFGVPLEELGLKFPFSLKGDSSFTQKLDKGYNNFLMMTPTKLKENFFEDNQRTEEKEDKKDNERLAFLTRIDNVTRTLNFGHDKGTVRRSNFLNSIKKKVSIEDLTESLDKPYNTLSKDLMQIWNYIPGNNSTIKKWVNLMFLFSGV